MSGVNVLVLPGVTGDLKTFFTDVVMAKASPKLRPRSHSDRNRLKVTSLTEQAMRHLGEATPTFSSRRVGG